MCKYSVNNRNTSQRAVLLTIAAAICGMLMSPAHAQADGDVLKPVIIYGFDTSASMHEKFGGNGNTRFTKAIQELTGSTVLRDENGNIPRRPFYTWRVPRQVLMCDHSSCDYKTKYICYTRDSKYCYDEGKYYYHSSYYGYEYTKRKSCSYPYDNCDAHILLRRNSNGESSGGDDFNYSEDLSGIDLGYDVYKQSDLSLFDQQYNKDGIIHRYLKSVKFGFVAMSAKGKNWSNNGVGGSVIQRGDENGYTLDESNTSYGPFLVHSGKNYSIWNNDVLRAETPTIFPTPADDDDIVAANNMMIIRNVRSYIMSSFGTPLGGMLEEVAFMLGAKGDGKIGKPYNGMLKQPKVMEYKGKSFDSNNDLNFKIDSQWACRKKAFLLMVSAL